MHASKTIKIIHSKRRRAKKVISGQLFNKRIREFIKNRKLVKIRINNIMNEPDIGTLYNEISKKQKELDKLMSKRIDSLEPNQELKKTAIELTVLMKELTRLMVK
ncbi:MAG: hypothetical protein COS17_06625 [Elusimicrobia bacterium CG02_land_8_20_14_3_00_37_13]|nr:MAG: hypothetical protein COS17_06625 [Elusimicrobia bacterium CG02_land_8_20_14_3_00_37_13]